MNINQDVLDGRIKRVCGQARERRGLRANNNREIALGLLAHTAGALQEQRGRLAVRLEEVRNRLDASALNPGVRT
jgi:hypothetical protein